MSMLILTQALPASAATATTNLTASNPTGYARFGDAVAVSADGTTTVVTARYRRGTSGELPRGLYVYSNVPTAAGGTRTETTFIAPTAPTGSNTDPAAMSLAVSSTGSTIVLGAPGDASLVGAVYVFTRSGSTYTQTARLTPPSGVTVSDYGRSVAVSADGTRLVVGAPTNSSSTATGAAFVYTAASNTWTLRGTVNGDAARARAGAAVAISGNGTIVAVASPREDNSATIRPQVRTFTFSGTALTANGTVNDPTPPEVVAGSSYPIATQYGLNQISLDAAGNTLVVGAPKAFTTNLKGGLTYVYTRSATTSAWSGAGVLSSTVTASGDNLGYSVSVSPDGKAIVAGAPFHQQRGAAFLWQRVGTDWATLGAQAYGQGTDEQFGFSTSITNALRIGVGAPFRTAGAYTRNGGAALLDIS